MNGSDHFNEYGVGSIVGGGGKNYPPVNFLCPSSCGFFIQTF